jgi:hypothetical protein
VPAVIALLVHVALLVVSLALLWLLLLGWFGR